MKELWWKAGFGALIFLLLPASAANAEIQPPEVGTVTKFKCSSGPYYENRTDTVSEINGGVVRFEIVKDGKAEWIEKPVNALGLGVFKRSKRNDGKGVHKQSLDDNVLAQYAKLEPGSEFEFDVRHRHDKGKFQWHYKVKVGQPETISHDLLGEIQVISVFEEKKVWKGKYSSKKNILLYPERGMFIEWTYKDPKGTEKCKLVEVN